MLLSGSGVQRRRPFSSPVYITGIAFVTEIFLSAVGLIRRIGTRDRNSSVAISGKSDAYLTGKSQAGV